MTVDVLQMDRRGQQRPGPTWKRYDIAILRLNRLASDIEAERDRHETGSVVHVLVDQAARTLRRAAEAVASPD